MLSQAPLGLILLKEEQPALGRTEGWQEGVAGKVAGETTPRAESLVTMAPSLLWLHVAEADLAVWCPLVFTLTLYLTPHSSVPSCTYSLVTGIALHINTSSEADWVLTIFFWHLGNGCPGPGFTA